MKSLAIKKVKKSTNMLYEFGDHSADAAPVSTTTDTDPTNTTVTILTTVSSMLNPGAVAGPLKN